MYERLALAADRINPRIVDLQANFATVVETRGVDLGWPTWIGVVAADLEQQRWFYRDVLGFTEIAAGADWVQFDLGESRLLEIVARSDQPQYDATRYQVGFAVDDIEGARDVLVERGVEAISSLDGDATTGGRWCYFRDPEGNVFELKERLRSR
jgi:catechol 2,3-dioxygenase-like lactoylglutathione lyase family enzyme